MNYDFNGKPQPQTPHWQVVEPHPHPGRQQFATSDLSPLRRRQKLRLTVMSDRGERDICLLAGQGFGLGRDYEISDLTLAVPESSDPSLRQRWISRQHARIEFTSDGPQWLN